MENATPKRTDVVDGAQHVFVWRVSIDVSAMVLQGATIYTAISAATCAPGNTALQGFV